MDEQNNFYTSISKYYSEIFPYRPMQLKYVENRVGDINKKKILDIGCATGELAYQLATNGAQVTGIDLNSDLLEQAVKNKQHEGLSFQMGDMLELDKDFEKEQFNAVLCFGNTLVHLPNLKGVKQMLLGANNVLKSGGKLLVQILNYDHILSDKVGELPLIETNKIKFIRKYVFLKNNSLIRFQTHLEIKAENKTVYNETSLLALTSTELSQLLKRAGFSRIKFYANFKMDAFGGKHLPLVLECEKS